jgi:hypothetical protein
MQRPPTIRIPQRKKKVKWGCCNHSQNKTNERNREVVCSAPVQPPASSLQPPVLLPFCLHQWSHSSSPIIHSRFLARLNTVLPPKVEKSVVFLTGKYQSRYIVIYVSPVFTFVLQKLLQGRKQRKVEDEVSI